MIVLQLVIGIFVMPVRNRAQKPCDNVLNATSCNVDGDGGNILSIVDQGSCVRYSKYCCWDGKRCFNRRARNEGQKGNETVDSGEDLPFEFPDLEEERSATGTNNSRRSLLPECRPPLAFPVTCNIKRNEPYVSQPPVDVPYCMRIPCSEDNVVQLELDEDHRKCGTTPGCYFDVELFRLRKQVSASILVGVPVCHFAIRKPVFEEKAQFVIKKFGFWNPYFTNCLLQTFKDDLAAEHPGCSILPTLLTFSISPKFKGWKDITSFECRLIDGCWLPGKGCHSPVNPTEVTLKSTPNSLFNPFEVSHGRPKCQNFNSENSYEVIKSYHNCLSAGCTVDFTITDFYHTYLFNIGYQMSISDHQQYWSDVMEGKIATIEELESMSYVRNMSKPSDSSVVDGKCGKSNRPCPPITPPPPFKRPCPYQPLNIPANLNPLKGSFVGCCDTDICYQPKADLKVTYSGPSAYYTGWSFYGPCSQVCGEGTRKRYRKCVSHDPALCAEELEQTKSCSDGPCGRWGKWGPWRKCRGQKGRLFKSRVRKCFPKRAKCLGISVDRKKCQYKACGK